MSVEKIAAKRGRPRGWDDKTEQNTIKSLDRAMSVFEFLSEDQGKSLSTLATQTQQSPATVYRILVTLEGRGLVEFDADTQLWHIGARAFVIGARYLRRTGLVERAQPILRQLMEDTGETANLGVDRGGLVLFLSQVETDASIRAFFPPGTLSAMHASGIGKALLSQMSTAQFDRWFLEHPPTRYSPHTLTDRTALQTELANIHERGFAVDNEEKNAGMRCIAAPVFDMTQTAVAGVSISGPTSRMAPDATDRLATHVIAAARSLTQAMGGAP